MNDTAAAAVAVVADAARPDAVRPDAVRPNGRQATVWKNPCLREEEGTGAEEGLLACGVVAADEVAGLVLQSSGPRH